MKLSSSWWQRQRARPLVDSRASSGSYLHHSKTFAYTEKRGSMEREIKSLSGAALRASGSNSCPPPQAFCRITMMQCAVSQLNTAWKTRENEQSTASALFR